MKILNTVVIASILVLSTSVNAELVGRLAATPGGTDYQAYYDDVTKLTWLADANAAGGPMNWADANIWAENLIIGDVSGWRLPSADINNDGIVLNCSGGGVVDCADNEMGFLYWEEGITTATPGSFINLQPNLYWSGTESALFPTIDSWFLFFSDGYQGADFQNESGYAWAVYSGDVSAVPVPAAAWLFGSGLVGLIALARRKSPNI